MLSIINPDWSDVSSDHLVTAQILTSEGACRRSDYLVALQKVEQFPIPHNVNILGKPIKDGNNTLEHKVGTIPRRAYTLHTPGLEEKKGGLGWTVVLTSKSEAREPSPWMST